MIHRFLAYLTLNCALTLCFQDIGLLQHTLMNCGLSHALQIRMSAMTHEVAVSIATQSVPAE